MDNSYIIKNYTKLDRILVELCGMILQGQKTNPEKFGMVAACVLDTHNTKVCRVNYLTEDGKRVHAERAAMNAYEKQYGDIPEGSIIITTLSPCAEPMDDRFGRSCTHLINNSNVHKVYCGYVDPTQHGIPRDVRSFALKETENSIIKKACKKIADNFL